MYHPQVISAARARLEEAYGVSLQEHSPEECKAWCDRLSSAWDEEKSTQIRTLTPEENIFVQNELLLTKIDFRYWAQRYAMIVTKSGGLHPMFPLLDSQEFVYQKMAELEATSEDRHDGILVNVLKAARQVGVSTLSEALIAHRLSTQNYIFALIAAGVPEDSGHLFSIMERMLENLPWWLRPQETDHVKNTEIVFDGGARVWTGAGKSMKGSYGQRGQIARGRTPHMVHLTELSTWESPDQIDDSLMPAVPEQPRTLALFESTAKGRGNWWHRHWQKSKAGLGRFTCVYIPWYVEKSYTRPAPSSWIPNENTHIHAKKIEETSEMWAGKQIIPTRDQLYWYETKRMEYEIDDKLAAFLEEFGSIDDDECFQNSGRGVVPSKVLEILKNTARPIGGTFELIAPQESR